MHEGECVGAVVCKLDIHRKSVRRGYIAMLAVDQKYRKRKIGSNLVLKAIRAMSADNADEVSYLNIFFKLTLSILFDFVSLVRNKSMVIL